MNNFDNKRFLIVDFELPHANEIQTNFKMCNPSFIIDITYDESLKHKDPRNYDAVFVCTGIFEQCQDYIFTFTKNNLYKKELKVFVLFHKLPYMTQENLNQIYKHEWVDGALNLPFNSTDLFEKLGGMRGVKVNTGDSR